MADAKEAIGHRSNHGAHPPRGLDRSGVDGSRGGRFGRMFPCLRVRPLSPDAFAWVFKHFAFHQQDVISLGVNVNAPSGYTYFGQFVDHDITYDPSSLQEQTDDPKALVNFRTPRFDLDSLYGSGPSDQPFIYEWEKIDDRGVKLLVERRDKETGKLLVGKPPAGGDVFSDLPRNSQGRALIGDPRNDEHLIIAQLHLMFAEFHNAVVEHVRSTQGLRSGAELFDEATRIVRWHYQWIVIHDFLSRIVGNSLASEVTAPDYERRCYRWEHEPFIPVEFSGAAYRFGHSMVRPGYLMNEGTGAEVPIFPTTPESPNSLRGFQPLPPAFVIDWRLFFGLGPLPQTRAHLQAPQLSMPLDTVVVKRLFHMPPEVSTSLGTELPKLNLLRACHLNLPGGPDVARAMGERPLDAGQLQVAHGADFFASPAIRDELVDNAPLWYYILREASALHDGMQLGPVGGRIVAEVLVGLLDGDPSSYVRQSPDWVPELEGATKGDFTMADLIRFTHPEYGPA